MPEISVVVATTNRATLLRDALKSLQRQTVDRSRYQVVIVDDGSTDETRRVAHDFDCEMSIVYAYQRQSGLAAAKNHGLCLASAPIVLFHDDDDVAAPSLLEEHLLAHGRFPQEHCAILGHTLLSPSLRTDPLMDYVTRVGCQLFSYPQLHDGDVLDYSYFWGGRSSCKRGFLLDRGLFNVVFRFGCEDVELGYRLSGYGFHVVYHARAVTVMARALSVNEFCARAERQGRSNFIFSELHPEPAIRAWTHAADAQRRWREIAPRYDATVASARHLDGMARRKSDLGFDVTLDETRCLHEAYGAAFSAALVKGFSDCAAETQRR